MPSKNVKKISTVEEKYCWKRTGTRKKQVAGRRLIEKVRGLQCCVMKKVRKVSGRRGSASKERNKNLVLYIESGETTDGHLAGLLRELDWISTARVIRERTQGRRDSGMKVEKVLTFRRGGDANNSESSQEPECTLSLLRKHKLL
jgi:hypothetical protein